MKWQEAEKQSLIRLRDMILNECEVEYRTFFETEILFFWGWEGSAAVLKEHGLLDVVNRITESERRENIWVGAGGFSSYCAAWLDDDSVSVGFEVGLDFDSINISSSLEVALADPLVVSQAAAEAAEKWLTYQQHSLWVPNPETR